MPNPGYGHKALYLFCCGVIIATALYLGFGLVLSGLRIMLFGVHLILVPVLCLAGVYMIWHARKFFK